MTLRAGSTLGHFEILGLLGMGGMGEVYHARDLKLGREVAIKVLPARVAGDENLLQRFEREARALAAINHPHIAALYSVEHAEGIRFLVMELVGGRTLQERLRTGAMPVEEVLALFAQIAEALEAAHERGIIHRDLKPANVKVTEDDRVKVLDFGLAKGSEVAPVSGGGGTVALEPESGLTAEGAIVGTIAYMSPEQARGKAVDKRTDIWAFGCMLFEALAGEPPFRGDTASDTLARILEREPDWKRLRPETPSRVRELLWRCLQKDPRRRLRDIGEAWFEIREHQSSSTSAPFSPPPTGEARRHPLRIAALLLLALLIGSGASYLFLRPRSVPAVGSPVRTARGMPPRDAVRRYSIELPPGVSSAVVPFFAISPDGRLLAYSTSDAAKPGVFIRALDQYESLYLPGTEQAYAPFFSPSGDWLGLMRNQGGELQILKVPSTGGAVTLVASAPSHPQSGQSWGEGDWIVADLSLSSGLYRVRATGGALEPLTTLDPELRENMHIYPQMLPGGEQVLFTAVARDEKGETRGGIEVMNPETRERKTILTGAAYAKYVASGHLLYVPYSTSATPPSVMGAAFDLERLEIIGKRDTPVLNDVYIHPVSYQAHFDVADDGTLAYIPRVPHESELVWVDRNGGTRSLPLPPRDYRSPRLSPDGRRIAVTIQDEGRQDVWIFDLDRASLSRLTLSGSAHSPLWRPDASEIIVSARRDRFVNLFAVNAEGSGAERLLTHAEAFECPTSFSDDGAVMTWSTLDLRQSSYNIAIGEPSLETTPEPYFDSSYWEVSPSISPDGRWVAFASNRTGVQEVYVAPYPGPGGILQISNQGGSEPRWARTGREVFYRQGDRMIAVEIESGPTPKAGLPETLFEGRYVEADLGFAQDYDVAPDGRFLMVRRLDKRADSSPQIQRINVVLNWFDELNRLVPPVPAEGG